MDETNVHSRIVEALESLTSGLSVLLQANISRLLHPDKISLDNQHFNTSVGPAVEPQNTTHTTTNTTTHNTTCDICCYYASPLLYVYISHVLCTHLSWLIILMGLVSNILSMLTFRSKTLRRSSTVVYLFYLSLSDNIYLFTVFFTRILECLKCLYFPTVAMDIYNRSSLACKGLQYILDVASDFSTSVILMVAIERYIACYHPVFHRKNCTIRSAQISIVILVCMICTLSAPHHLLYVEHYADVKTCDVSRNYKARFNTMYMSEVMLFRIIPVYAIASMNILIFCKLWKRTKRMVYKQVQINQSNTALAQNANHTTNNNNNNIKVQKSQLTNVTLLTMSTFYFICYQPIILCYILSSISSGVDISGEVIVVFRNYARLLCILGYSMNFFLYTMSGNLFRKEFQLCVLERICRK